MNDEQQQKADIYFNNLRIARCRASWPDFMACWEACLSANTVTKWVSVKERLPDMCGRYVVIIDGGNFVGITTENLTIMGKWRPATGCTVTHWLDGVPTIPEQEETK